MYTLEKVVIKKKEIMKFYFNLFVGLFLQGYLNP